MRNQHRARNRKRCVTVLTLVLGFAFTAERGACQQPKEDVGPRLTREQTDYFERHIRPVLVEQCYECHSSKASPVQGGLRVDLASTTRTGGDSGPAIVPGKPEESLLIESLQYESYEMPPGGKLPEKVIAHFQRWIEMGAPDPRYASPEQASHADAATDGDRHWAFQPPILVDPPATQAADWPRTDVDRFILARLEQEGLAPSPPADARTLLRRVYFDLIGLPPTADEVAEFQNQSRDEDYQAVVDQLLASEHFGERWGRYWLDVARYADTKGYVFREDRNYPHAHTYRDWVIKALNDDMPYDRFIFAQLAADQLDDPSAAPAMGFLTLGRRFINNKHDIIDDRIDVVTRGLMGLTGSCARCHDHKYDPITMADYYGMYGVFASSREPREETAPLLMVDADQPSEPFVFIRGNPANRGAQVPRRFIAFFSDADARPFERGSGRQEMAEKIASADNPLTARVWVNRVWLHLWGQPLVRTPSDFGTRSDPPSHPQLLDWLACRFIAEGWSTKWLIRQIVLSSAYRQSSDDRPDCREADPENRLLWQMNRRRLDLEALRDSLLVAAGRLDTTMGGPSVKLTEQPYPTRRAVYGFIERQNLPGFFRTFDFAGPDTHSPGRPYTTVPQQALYLMNSPFVIQQAVHLANRDEVRTAVSNAERIEHLFRCALGRGPSADELSWAQAFLEKDEAAGDSADFNDINPWQYGWGQYDGQTKRVQFHTLPHFTGSAWQGGAKLPDPELGWVTLSDSGGHPGDDQAHAAIRRWVAPRAGTVGIEGTLEHSSDQGDGVRGRVVSDRGELLAEWAAHHGKTITRMEPFDVQAGESIDFVVDCLSGPSHDSFDWTFSIRLEAAADTGRQAWSSAADFRGPRPDRLGRWERLAQVLLMTNEFMFVD